MAAPNYYQALSEMPAPQRGGEAATIAASEATAKGIGIQSQKDADLTKFLGTTALEAFKGYKEATLQKEIDSTLNNTYVPGQYVGESVLARETLFNQQKRQLSDVAGYNEGDDAQLNQFKQQVDMLGEAKNQGTLTREQAVARIAAAVKSWSADVPGLASEFRKLAAEQTGISNIDVLGVHTALTSKAKEDERAKALFNAQVDLDKDIAKNLGKPITSITQDDRQVWYQRKQSEFAIAGAKTQIESGNLVQGEVDKVHDSIATNKIFTAVADISLGMNKLYETLPGATIADKVKTDQAGIAMDGMLSNLQMTLERSLLSQATKGADNPQPWNPETADKRIKSMRDTFTQYREMLKSAEGRQMFSKMVENQKGNVSLLTNSFLAANPGVAVYNELKILPAFTQLYAAYGGDEKKLTAAVGKDVAGVIISAFKDPQRYGKMTAQSIKDPAFVNDLNKVDPETAKAIVTEARFTAKNTAKTAATWDVNTPKSFSATVATWGQGWNSLKESDMTEWKQFIQSPDSKKAFDKLTLEEKQAALHPFLIKTETATPLIAAQIKTILDTVNKEVGGKPVVAYPLTEGGAATGLYPNTQQRRASSFKGVELEVVQDRITGALVVNRKDTTKQLAYDPNEEIKLRQAVAQMNTLATNAADLVPMIGGKTSAREMYNRVATIISNPTERLVPQSALEPIPTPPPQRRATDRVSTKATAAESDRPQVLKEVAAETQQQLSAYERIDPSKLTDVDRAQMARLRRDLEDIKTAK